MFHHTETIVILQKFGPRAMGIPIIIEAFVFHHTETTVILEKFGERAMGIPIIIEDFVLHHTETTIILEEFLRPRRNQDSSTPCAATLRDAKTL